MNNKHGQAESIIIFFVLIVAILIVSIIILRMTNSIITPFAQQLNQSGYTQASNLASGVQSKFTSVWDWMIIILILFNIIILLVSAFLVDIHPAFLVIYIFAGFFLFIFGNFALQSLDSIWGYMGTATETSQTPLQQFIINNFQMIMLGIYILSGVLMYSKFKWFSGTGTGGNY